MDHFTNLFWIIHTQEVTSGGYHKQLQKTNYRLSQKVINSFKIIDPVINGFIPNDESSHLNICDHSIVKFGIG